MEKGYDEAYGESLWYTFCILNSFYIIGSCKVKKSDKERPHIHKQYSHTHTNIDIFRRYYLFGKIENYVSENSSCYYSY